MIAYFSNNVRFIVALAVIVVGVPFAMGLVDFDSYDPGVNDLNEMKKSSLRSPMFSSFGDDDKYKYYGNGEVIDVVSVESHPSANARSRVVYDIEYEILDDLYMANKEAKKDEDIKFTKKYSKGDTFVKRQASLIGRDMDQFGSPKRPYEFRGIVPLKLLPEEEIEKAQFLLDIQEKSGLLHRLMVPKTYLDDMVAKGLINSEQIAK